MNIKIDCCSKPCPQPVLDTKKAIEDNPGKPITVIVDDEAARMNVTRYAKNFGYNVEETEENGSFKLDLNPSDDNDKIIKKETIKTGAVFFIRTFGIGSSEPELAQLLMKTFLQTIPSVSPYPASIIFMNEGVKHTVEDAENLENLIILEELGIEIIVCGTCLDYFGLKEKFKVGRISNFYEIATIMNSSSNTITL